MKFIFSCNIIEFWTHLKKKNFTSPCAYSLPVTILKLFSYKFEIIEHRALCSWTFLFFHGTLKELPVFLTFCKVIDFLPRITRCFWYLKEANYLCSFVTEFNCSSVKVLTAMKAMWPPFRSYRAIDLSCLLPGFHYQCFQKKLI